MSEAPPVVEFHNVTKIFNAGTPRASTAIQNISFCVEDLPGKGEFIAMVGPSGCGKSTILNLIAAFQEVYPPTSGKILVRGQPVVGPGPDRGMVFQKYSSFPHLTVRENVRFGLEANRGVSGMNESAMEEKARDWINRVGLSGHEHKYPHQLSGGQQQRVALARTLVLHPKIILMDEAFSALDEPTRVEMQKLLVNLWREVEATVFLVTHSLSEAAYLGDRVWLFSRGPGRLVKEFKDMPKAVPGQPPHELQKTPQFLDVLDEIVSAFRKAERGEG